MFVEFRIAQDRNGGQGKFADKTREPPGAIRRFPRIACPMALLVLLIAVLLLWISYRRRILLPPWSRPRPNKPVGRFRTH